MDTLFIDITVIIPNWNGEKWLPGCLDALLKQRYQNFRTLVVDNGSEDRSRILLQTTYPWVDTILLPNNQGFSTAINIGIRRADTKFIVLLNNDTIPSPNWLLNLHTVIMTTSCEIGSLASCMVMMDNPLLIDDAGDILTWSGSAIKRGHGSPRSDYLESVEVFSACAGAALYRHTALMKSGLFDEEFVSYLEDIDLGLRLRLAGYRCLYVPEAVVMHKGHGSGLSRKRYVTYMTRNRLLLFLKNIPVSLLIANGPRLLAGQIWYGIVYRNFFASCAGYISCLRMLPLVIHNRRGMGKKRILSREEIQSLLTDK